MVIAVAAALFRTGKPVRSLAGSGIQGICALAAVNVAGRFHQRFPGAEPVFRAGVSGAGHPRRDRSAAAQAAVQYGMTAIGR